MDVFFKSIWLRQRRVSKPAHSGGSELLRHGESHQTTLASNGFGHDFKHCVILFPLCKSMFLCSACAGVVTGQASDTSGAIGLGLELSISALPAPGLRLKDTSQCPLTGLSQCHRTALSQCQSALAAPMLLYALAQCTTSVVLPEAIAEQWPRNFVGVQALGHSCHRPRFK